MEPAGVSVTSFQVGFGDCFLLSVEYHNGETRHALIDFGTTSKAAGQQDMSDIAEMIRDRTAGRLDLVAATHRHRDHISGFAGQAGDVISGLEIGTVVQPWTEDPRIEPDAKAPATDAGLRFALSAMESFSLHALIEYVEMSQSVSRFDASPSLATSLNFLGQLNIKNREAVENLIQLGEDAETNPQFVKYGDEVATGDAVLPGVRIRVLGPPTVKQWAAISRRPTDTDEEFWQASANQYWNTYGRIAAANQWDATTSRGALLDSDEKDPKPPEEWATFPGYPTVPMGRLPYSARWAVASSQTVRGNQLLSIVRNLDKGLNNTSLILLVDVGDQRLLFPGDAQIENWQYALFEAPDGQAEQNRRDLGSVDLYKVGHHGSLNATPKTLWNGFSKRSTDRRGRRLISVLSTKEDVHGEEDAGTEVPRRTLVEALAAESTLFRTDGLQQPVLEVPPLLFNSDDRLVQFDQSPAGDWKVQKPGSKRVSARAATQQAAIARAIQIVRNLGTGSVLVFTRDGRLRRSMTPNQ